MGWSWGWRVKETGHELGARFSYVSTFQQEISRDQESEPGLPCYPELLYVTRGGWDTLHRVLAWFITLTVSSCRPEVGGPPRVLLFWARQMSGASLVGPAWWEPQEKPSLSEKQLNILFHLHSLLLTLPSSIASGFLQGRARGALHFMHISISLSPSSAPPLLDALS